MRQKVVAVDFDETLVHYDEDGMPLAVKGAREAMQALRDQGAWLVIFTCRIPIARRRGQLDSELEFIEATLVSFGIPFDEVFTGDNKVVADVYIDDRAEPFAGDWHAILAGTLAKLNRS